MNVDLEQMQIKPRRGRNVLLSWRESRLESKYPWSANPQNARGESRRILLNAD